MIRNLFEAVALIKAAPEKLKNFKELLDYARNIYKETTGVFPDGIDFLTLKNAAREVANIRDPKKVVQFPGGGKDKVSPFKERPGEGELSVTIEGETKNMTPEGIMDLLMGKGKAKDVNIGTAPKTTKKKPPVDPELKKSDDRKQLFMDFEDRNKKGQLLNLSGQKGKFLTEDEFARELESNTANFIQNSPGFNLQLIPNLKKPGAKAYNPFPDKQGDKFLTDDQRQRVLSKLEKIMKNEEYQMRFADNFVDLMEEGDDVIEFAPDLFKIDPPKKADGGRIGFGSGSVNPVGFPGNQTEESQPGGGQMEMPRNTGFQPIFPMPQKNIPGSGGIKELRQFLQAVGAPELGMGYNFPVGQSGILGVGVAPSGNVGAQLKIPLSGGRFGFKDGSKPKDPSRRTFIKGMAGLAALPFVGKFFKPAAKVVEKAAPVVQEGAKLGFENFMLLVDKIKRLGKSADNLATKEREKVIRYEGKDGSDYELVEDLTTGDISITKDKPGIAVYGRGTDDVEGIDVIEDRSTFIYRKGEDVVDTKTGKSKRSPDEYEELQQTSGDGEGFDGIDEIDDKIVNDVINELTDVAPIDDLTANQYMGTKNLRSKKAGGGLAYMLGE
jgi:hypothetical protein